MTASSLLSYPTMASPKKIRVWDLPTRLFHWLLVACIVGSYVTIKVGGLWLDYHLLFGYTTLGLILFRIVWGFVGPEPVRFRHFVRGPAAVMAYLKGTRVRDTGHNPLGAVSVVAMLALLGYQAVTGLFATDDILSSGPLSARVDSDLASTLTGLHKLDEWPILILVALHVLAIIYYRIAKKQKLAAAMITGDAPADEFHSAAEPTRDTWKVRGTALVIAVVAAGVVYWITTLRVSSGY
ncbi:cytochrome b/b6 domain-containing protein [Pigmentiphaga litoralis]|uniref:Cytochrome b n=1 Tax=Pigmentiphaga litoralis TaxID=516702 RepID=A0A7Y9IY78_9BURK|nr:cytochrome b/b6 domain-containing protein [Pigmentiphaga litoralis]NYE26101.1 cytochrome b [Pigmentiphaga litoralis]NYE85221.1 cytochrome b [Pigmentiphaga litoralis]